MESRPKFKAGMTCSILVGNCLFGTLQAQTTLPPRLGKAGLFSLYFFQIWYLKCLQAAAKAVPIAKGVAVAGPMEAASSKDD